MHLAAAQGHLEAVRALLEKGASLAVQCKMVLVRAEEVGQDVWLLIFHEIILPLLGPGGSGVTNFWSFRTLRPYRAHLLRPCCRVAAQQHPTRRRCTWQLPGGTRLWCS